MSTRNYPLSRFVAAAAPYLLILLFMYAAASKLMAFADFRAQLLNQTFPHSWVPVLARLVPALEFTACGLLAFSGTEKYGLWISAALLTVFSGYIGLVLLHAWSRVPCSCGGILNHMSWGTHLVFNLVFLGLAITGLLKVR